ncbi:hypothetical protein [Microlunatus flavus]|uniref:Uncharacterized protein n=1 Tax=Microlunatus flavus TaxID=1036181 RepID=A0A1H9CSU6_9ACTN|nr:hypothetical protein [Microlunatus flavus]SEQ04244.1 hypothetical protein SAMN05421756_102316 [Microlunatus flavus]
MPAAVGPEVLEVAPRQADRRLLLVLGVGALLVALVLGGLALVDRVRGGASSPRGLAERVVTALDHEDLAALGRLVEPSERAALLRTGAALSQHLADLGLPEAVGGGSRPRHPLDGLDLSLTGASPHVESQDGDVAVVGLGPLVVRVRSDPDRAHGLLRTWFADRRMSAPEDETYAVDDLPALGVRKRLVTVERDGRWYVSVLATLLGPGVPPGSLADVEALDPAPSPTPGAAVEATVRALLDPVTRRDPTALARTLDASGSDTVQLWAAQLAIVGLDRPPAPITALSTSPGTDDGTRAVVRVGALTVGTGSGFDLDGPCVTTNGDRACLRSSGYRYAGGAGTLGQLELLGHDGAFSLTAVHDDAGWRTSLPESLADAVIGYADGLTRAQVLMVLNTERSDTPSAVLEPDRPQDVTFTSGGYALLTVPVTQAGLLRVVPSPTGGNRASLYAPDGQPALQPFFPNDSVYRVTPGEHTLLVWADDEFSDTLRTGRPYVQRVEVRSIR